MHATNGVKRVIECKCHVFPRLCMCIECVYQAVLQEGGDKLFIIPITTYGCFYLILWWISCQFILTSSGTYTKVIKFKALPY